MPKWSGGDVPLGLKVPETREQEQLLQKTAELVLRGMINAAKADGQISPGEVERIVGKLRETGLDDSSQQWLIAEPQNPLDLRTFADEIPNQEVAAEVYAASLLAVDVDLEGRVLGVEIDHRDAVDRTRRVREGHVDLGPVRSWVGEKYEYPVHVLPSGSAAPCLRSLDVRCSRARLPW